MQALQVDCVVQNTIVKVRALHFLFHTCSSSLKWGYFEPPKCCVCWLSHITNYAYKKWRLSFQVDIWLCRPLAPILMPNSKKVYTQVVHDHLMSFFFKMVSKKISHFNQFSFGSVYYTNHPRNIMVTMSISICIPMLVSVVYLGLSKWYVIFGRRYLLL